MKTSVSQQLKDKESYGDADWCPPLQFHVKKKKKNKSIVCIEIQEEILATIRPSKLCLKRSEDKYCDPKIQMVLVISQV